MSVDLNKGATVELVKTLSDDLRTKDDGTKYNSAGDAVRDNASKVTDLKTDFKYIDEGHIKTELTVTAGRYINKSGVLVVNNNQHLAISDYIKIPAQTYKIIGTKHPANISDILYAMNFYDGAKTWLGGFDYYQSGTIESADFPEGSEYVVLQDYDPDTPILHNKCSVTFYAFTLTENVNNLIAQTDVSTEGIVNDIFTDKTANKNTNINYTTGDAQNNPNFLATNYIEVKPNTAYHVMRDNQLVSGTANMAFYSETKQYISGIPSTWDNWTTPANAKYVRISVYMSPWTQDTFTFDNVQIIEGTEAKVINDNALFTKAYYSPLNGKKWIGIGDSLTEVNARSDVRYWNYIANPNNMTFVNMGVGGSGYIQRQNENKAFYQRVSDMETDADIITIFGGVNDCLFASAPIGEPTDTGTTTWCGCVNTLIDNIRSKYLYANIGIISPLPCDWIDTNNESNYDTQLPSDTSCRMSEFVGKLETICALRGVPFLDIFHQSNMRPDNADFRAEYYSCGTTRNGDGLHPNSKGHKLFYRKIQQFIESMIQ